jgi:hypothetical protein
MDSASLGTTGRNTIRSPTIVGLSVNEFMARNVACQQTMIRG